MIRGFAVQEGDVMSQEVFMARQEQDLAGRVPAVLRLRKDLGLEGLVQGLDSVIISTEHGRLIPAVAELLRYTGFEIESCFEDESYTTFALGTQGSASLLIRARKKGDNPFNKVNAAEKTKNLPNTRLETFVFRTTGLEQYVEIQSERGVRFMTPGIIEYPSFRFIQTIPSRYTGNSLGFIEWTGKKGDFAPQNAVPLLPPNLKKPALPHLANIHRLDHAATRVRALERNDAIIEFMELSAYTFDFAVFVKSLNSITSVARLSKNDFAMVFTSGIEPFREDTDPGPTEMFIRNYGTRVHHMAFQTDHITETYDALKKDGMEFLVELVGSEDEGLKQTFSVPSPHTMIVNEYIQRYEGFDGFFTKSNVELLTRATGRQ
jgi:4-hydroxyphenylpyruvate dioxygenase-like putative hemolysin